MTHARERAADARLCDRADRGGEGMTPGDDVAAIAAGLTKAQREVVNAMSDDFAPAPTCGWHRSQGAVCGNLSTKGVVEKRSEMLPLYRLTPLGLAVRAHLLAQEPQS